MKSVFQFFSGKISVTALTPLYRLPKYPYIRGDTCRGEGGRWGCQRSIPCGPRGWTQIKLLKRFGGFTGEYYLCSTYKTK